MDGTRFDALARTLATGSSRRGFLRGMVGAALGATAVARLESEAIGAPGNCGGCKAGTTCPTDDCCNVAECNIADCVDWVNGYCQILCGQLRETCSADGDCCSGKCANGKCACLAANEKICTLSGTDYCVPKSQNCGPCPTGSFCDGCPVGTRKCNGFCVDTKSDRNNCGTCGVKCAKNQTCSNGTCCPIGTIKCNGACVPPIECA